MKKILFIYPILIPSIKQDLEILSKQYEIVEFSFNPLKKIFTPLVIIKQLFFLMYHWKSCSGIIVQFAAYHSFFPVIISKLFRKKCFIVLRGTDCEKLPSINYGNHSKKLLSIFTYLSIKYATHLLPVSHALVECEYSYTNSDYKGQGFKYFFPEIMTPYTVIHNGINPDKFYILKDSVNRDKLTFLTIINRMDNEKELKRKGIYLIIEVAKMLPEFDFTIIGKKSNFDFDLPANIKIIDFIPNEKLVLYYNEFRFYLQLSMTEGFGMALGESMLCGCVPIVSNVSIMPFITKDCGYVLAKMDVFMLRNLLIEAANQNTDKLSLNSRDRILNLFSLENRKHKLLKFFNSNI